MKGQAIKMETFVGIAFDDEFSRIADEFAKIDASLKNVQEIVVKLQTRRVNIVTDVVSQAKASESDKVIEVVSGAMLQPTRIPENREITPEEIAILRGIAERAF